MPIKLDLLSLREIFLLNEEVFTKKQFIQNYFID